MLSAVLSGPKNKVKCFMMSFILSEIVNLDILGVIICTRI